MASTYEQSDDETYSYIGDKGDIGHIDYESRKATFNYKPDEESDIVSISIPFPLVDGKPRSGLVGETAYDCVTIKNITDEPLDLWEVRVYDSKPEDCFTISLGEPPNANSDEEYITRFMESSTMEDRTLAANQDLTIWISCKPKEIGLHTASIYFNAGNEVIERMIFVMAEDKISKSLASDKPYNRPRRKQQQVVNVREQEQKYFAGPRPSKGLGHGLRFKYRLPEYPIPADIKEMVSNKQIPGVVNEGLTEENYCAFFKALLAMEEIKLEEDMRDYNMERVSLKSMRHQFLSLEVPGLAEKRPSLVSGDYIFVKVVAEDDTEIVPYQGYIYRVEAEEIFLKFDQKFHRQHRSGYLYNVEFTYNRTSMRKLYQAVEAAKKLDMNFLFPSNSSINGPVRRRHRPLQPISHALNDEQIRAVEIILTHRGGSPYIIHGPPGTGKTMTLIEAILQVYCSKKDSRILVCAPSNSAADHILERLVRNTSVYILQKHIFRLNAFTRPFDDINPDFLDFCHHEDSVFKCPSFKDLVQRRIIISTYTSAAHIYAEGIKRGHFSYFFLDEAGQASEPETMVPLSHLYSRDAVVVLAGDPMQLGPVVFSKDAENFGLGTSYLERLFRSDSYNGGNKDFVVKLVRNYRTHAAILRLPSELFYDGELIPSRDENTASSRNWEDLIPDNKFPMLFMGVQGCDEREGSNPSWFNRIEASKVVEMIRALTEEKGMKDEDIGVITPYRQQACKIRGALENLGRSNVKVGSVEQFQGQEREVIIISTVRSTVKYDEFDRVHYLGFLSNPRRFNVAITRARSLLVLIGNPHILCKDPNWSKLLWYCVENGSYKGCFLPVKEDISSAPHYGDMNNNFQQSEGQWGHEGGDSWLQFSENQCGETGDSNWCDTNDCKPDDEKDNRQPSADGWGEADWGSADNWKQQSDCDKRDNLQPSATGWGEADWGSENNWKQQSDCDKKDHLQPSANGWAEADWGSENNWKQQSDGDKKDHLQPSASGWGEADCGSENNWRQQYDCYKKDDSADWRGTVKDNWEKSADKKWNKTDWRGDEGGDKCAADNGVKDNWGRSEWDVGEKCKLKPSGDYFLPSDKPWE